MDETFLSYYEDELRHIRDVAAEFGSAHPLVAGQLKLRTDGCGDPFVERLLEGFAFLAARVHQKLDADFPVFVQGLLETVYPALLTPIPATGIITLRPPDSATAAITVPRGTDFSSLLSEGSSTRCTFKSAHQVTVQPFLLSTEDGEQTRYFDRDFGALQLPKSREVRAAIRSTLHLPGGVLKFSELEDCDEMVLFIGGAYSAAGRVFEEILSETNRIYVRPVGGTRADCLELERGAPGGVELSVHGFEPKEALLETDSRIFSGHRMLMEYSSLPERLLFVKVKGLQRAFAEMKTDRVELIFGFRRASAELSKLVSADTFVLNATPVINLFEMRADQIPVDGTHGEFHIVANRAKPLNYEILGIKSVKGISADKSAKDTFEPFYRSSAAGAGTAGFYSIRREPRRLTHAERLNGARSRSLGSEVQLSLVDGSGGRFRGELDALSVRVLCSNRHLPLSIPLQGRDTDLIPDSGSGLSEARWVVPPTAPRDGLVNTTGAWRLLSQLSLNFLSLVESDEGGGAEALRSLLTNYFPSDSDGLEEWVQGLTAVRSKPVVERALRPGPIAFQRGLEVEIVLDETRFAGGSPFLFGAVLARFLSDHVSINSFVKTRVVSESRGPLMTWPGRSGVRPVL